MRTLDGFALERWGGLSRGPCPPLARGLPGCSASERLLELVVRLVGRLIPCDAPRLAEAEGIAANDCPFSCR